MEELYSKLYAKYTKLKERKASEIDEFNIYQEKKFKNFVSVAEELIGYLTNQKERLKAENSQLRLEVVSVRSAKDAEQEKYEKMLIDEDEKNRRLSEEIEVLRRKARTNDDMFVVEQLSRSPPSSAVGTKRKTRRNTVQEKGGEREHTALNRPEDGFDKENMFSGAFNNTNQDQHCNENVQQPRCCRRRLAGGSANGSASAPPTICVFQELVEYLVNLKFSLGTQSDDTIAICATHESSGYSFNLGWAKNVFKAPADRGNEEEDDELLMYRVSSLGTLERVAPEWMRDVMLFSKTMCPIFFKRVSAIV